MIIAKLRTELKQDKTTAYNAACTLANLVNSADKLSQLRAEVITRFEQATPNSIQIDESPIDLAVEREAEKMLIALVKMKKDCNSGYRV
ncbi:MAG TPA: hypothetical protein V6D17_25310 [Candidatus Obscuribacterales bacterium]